MIGVFVHLNEGSKNAQRFPVGYVIEESGCWSWVGSMAVNGYGIIHANGKNLRAHRWMYERIVAPIPDGLCLDHLCRNRRCVNPAHLEAVTLRENILRGESCVARRVRGDIPRVTHCKLGHHISGANAMILKRGEQRVPLCRECERARLRARRKAGYFRKYERKAA